MNDLMKDYAQNPISPIYDEVINIWGQGMDPETIRQMEAKWDDLVAKTIAFCEANNIPLQPGVVGKYKDQIVATPSPIGTEGPIPDKAKELKMDLGEKVKKLATGNYDTQKWVMLILGVLLVTVILGKFAKIVAWVGLAVLLILLYKNEQTQKKLLLK